MQSQSASFIVKASELLVSNGEGVEYAFLLPRGYVEHWIVWAKRCIGKNAANASKVNTQLTTYQKKYKLKDYLSDEKFQPSPINCTRISQNDRKRIQLKRSLSARDVIAVPETFYEFLRSSHGVLCKNNCGGITNVSYQAHTNDLSDVFLEHNTDTVNADLPIEFRRKLVQFSKTFDKESIEYIPLGDNYVCELYPTKIKYELIDAKSSREGTLQVSNFATVQQLCADACKVFAPDLSSSCIRIWYRPNITPSPTKLTDGYEVVEADVFAKTLLYEWDVNKVLIEIRPSVNQSWPREREELVNRLQIGDFVDARDNTGKWYEAVVQELESDRIKVHYLGWASKWDSYIPINYSSSSPKSRLPPPQPLWTRTNNWRENIQIGDIAEIREASSSIRKPKWFYGKILKVNKGEPFELNGGADLELNDKVRKKPLLLVNRRSQVLVEISDERNNVPNGITNFDAEIIPPFRRWVNLYGEEICPMNTHRKDDYKSKANKKPAMIQYGHVNGTLAVGSQRGFVRGKPVAPGSLGMTNLGNSCYMNASLQCLNHCRPLIDYFMQEDFKKDLNLSNPLGSGGRVANAFSAFLGDIWSNDYTVVSPSLLKHSIGLFAPQFHNSQQHDAQELCAVLLDALHEDTNKISEKPYVDMDIKGKHSEERRAMITWQRHIKRHNSVIVDHFQGMQKSHLRCIKCSHESVKFDVFSSLSLPLPPMLGKSKVPLSSCFDEFISSEQLDTENAWFCPKCSTHVRAKKRLSLWSTPDILILHLKRFGSSRVDFVSKKKGKKGVNTSKITDVIDFPVDKLDLGKYTNLPGSKDYSCYKLFGVAEHQGKSVNSGHYTATVLNCKNERQWYRYNDANVGVSTGDTAINSGAYVLFYERFSNGRRDVKRWAGMEDYMLKLNVDPYVEESDEIDEDGFVMVQATKGKKKSRK